MNLEDLMMVEIIDNLQDAEEQIQEPNREFLLRQDAFQLSDDNFIKYFRLSKEPVRYLIDLVSPYVEGPTRASALDVKVKVLIALQFYASGSYQAVTGLNVYMAVSQAAVSRAIQEVTNALQRPEIFNRFVRFPNNLQELADLRNRFFTKYRFPGVVGVVDCTHVAIVAPPANDVQNPEHIYVNRKQYHSINVQLICDENLRIMNINARFPGSTHDAYIWSNSMVSQTMEQNYRNAPDNIFFLLGDSGYPLRPWLMTPLRDVERGSPEERFNNRFKTVRSTIERCNGCLKNRFRCLLKHRVLHYAPSVARKIIIACAVLHNLCIAHNIPDPEEVEVVANADFGIYPNAELREHIIEWRVNSDLAAARQLQQHIVNQHF